jgi:hypothetical protein
MNKAAIFSTGREYRYALWRTWSGGSTPRYVMFIGLNPSTADETNDDPTIRRCIRFAQDWGYDGLVMTNLFAVRTKDPKVMKAHPSPVGDLNDQWLETLARNAAVVVAAWGADGGFRDRGEVVRQMLPRLHCLKVTKAGHPSHPLYLPASLRPVPWWESRA